MPEKYQKEIEDLLDNLSSLPSRPARKKRPSLVRIVMGGVGTLLGGRGRSISPGRIMLGAVILLLTAWWFTTMLPGLAGLVAWAAVILFILGYAFFFVSPGNSYQKRWRGEPLEQAPSQWWDRFRRRAKRE